jgi:4-hydroxyphenylpyruvate dioxygenase
MNYTEMLTWILFYASIFEVGKSPMVDIVDPSGLVRSQVIENASGALRLTLNGAENRNTLAGHFMAETFGSNVQHLAFASSDIFASSEAMRKAGFKRLAISPNYFDDIQARFQLTSDLVARLKAGDILYDRDAGGEYFQFYSQNYGEGFFFEIVQRAGQYKGYGAPNAPFRIAAQKRQIKSSAM